MIRIITSLLATLLFSICVSGQTPETPRPRTPIMGWSSWNNYHVNISEEIIQSQADAMAASGMKEAGYSYINIDDGFFGGRNENGGLLAHKKRFPSGMKALADYIHKKGLKAGIYSDAGINTCASYWDQDTIGSGMGLYGHEWSDLNLMLKEWGYDFIKIDWCGGQWLDLDEETRYTLLGKMIRSIRPDVVYNICRWEFPGKWALTTADSWRISGDITNTFESVMHIVDRNADLWKYSGPGHVNDMDMLQVGRGMGYEEDKTHFSMWCMLNSPLLAGNDLTKMSDETLEILTNKELISINQDPLVYQARKLEDHGDLELWTRPLGSTMSGRVAVALLNRSDKNQTMTLELEKVAIIPGEGYVVKDCWEHTTSSGMTKPTLSYEIPPHGVVVLKIDGTNPPFNVFQFENGKKPQ
ncbi:glycoside hydrolase family 27 protein [Marinilabilia salmonicolor]|uniref:Alpha-galactosidase n=1 Tax=Marinilabilia salmonicolor TaxID=989 RepID=A0A2T0XRR0_9BACT|nr:glycoside hydrolase family 27 protein [Marinilabilia salmonicolor]PRZ01644.1 alpha galactosidase A [Marinilabilia salmonicolor]RCW31584.1 alpha galactosidase A [Marinilabilia salmonicolor]